MTRTSFPIPYQHKSHENILFYTILDLQQCCGSVNISLGPNPDPRIRNPEYESTNPNPSGRLKTDPAGSLYPTRNYND
jgi:hypothetical protein